MKKTYIVLAMVSFFFFSTAMAETLQPKINESTFLYESLTLLDSVASSGTSTLDAAVYDTYRSIKAIIAVETADVRIRTDGTDPTTSEGMLLYIGDVYVVKGIADIRNISLISTSGSAKVRIHYIGEPQ